MKCPSCQALIKVSTEHAGRRIKCPKCQAISVVPPAVVKPEVTSPVIVQESPNITVEKTGKGPIKAKSKSIFRRYADWAGTRSIIFQSLLLAWTFFMFILGLGMMVSAAGSVKADMNSPFESERDAAAGAFFLAGLACPFSIYVLIAIPLGIAAIATLSAKKSE